MINLFMSLLQWIILSCFLQQDQDCCNRIIVLEVVFKGSYRQSFCELARIRQFLNHPKTIIRSNVAISSPSFLHIKTI